jgi:TolA-binding protein
MNKLGFFRSRVGALTRWACLAFALAALAGPGWGAEPAAVTTGAPARTDDTNAQEILRSYRQLQEQLHATQLAIEHSRAQAETAAAQSAKALTAPLSDIEQPLASQRAQELEAMQSSNKVMLLVAGVFAILGFLALLFMAYSQWRTINRLVETTSALPSARGLGAGDAPLLAAGAAELANQRLLGALERLENRIDELEHAAHPTLTRGSAPAPETQNPPPPSEGAAPASGPGGETAEVARINGLLGKGQSLLNLDQTEAAVACFDQVLALDPNHPDALLKKGAALERLRKLDEAVACYDQAIAADSSLTVAYLYKGGLFNRMERFSEALECYEKALHAQDPRHT